MISRDVVGRHGTVTLVRDGRGAWVVLLVAVTLLGATGCGGGAKTTTLDATVGPGYEIVLADAAGTPVTKLAPGRYDVVVHDKSAFLNFHFFGPGVNEATSIPGTGTSHWTVTLTAGTYQYQCDAHRSLLHGSFTVGG